MECHIGVISGDGIGPEIVEEAMNTDIRLRIKIF